MATKITDKSDIFYGLNIVYPHGEEGDPYYWGGFILIYDCDGDIYYDSVIPRALACDEFVLAIIKNTEESFNRGEDFGRLSQQADIRRALGIGKD